MQPLANPVNVDGKKLVVLRGLEHGNVFMSMSRKGEDPRFGAKGELWYDVLAYCDTDDEAHKVVRRADPGNAALCDLFEKSLKRGDQDTALRAAIALKPGLALDLAAMNFLDSVQCVYRTGCKNPRKCTIEGFCLQLKEHP